MTQKTKKNDLDDRVVGKTDDGTPITLGVLRERIRHGVKFLYDIQETRLAMDGRQKQAEAGKEVHLDPEDLGALYAYTEHLESLENEAEKHVKELARLHPMWDWLIDQKGLGTRTIGAMLSEIRIERAPTVSSLWKFCGLAVRDGEADHPVKGEKLSYNAWLKKKMLHDVGGGFIKSNSPWRAYYDNRKQRRQNQMVDPCMRCEGDGIDPYSDADRDVDCPNCGGTGGPAPWGESDQHRHLDARRIMVKTFLIEAWQVWRDTFNLPARDTYAEEYLDRDHTDKPADPNT